MLKSLPTLWSALLVLALLTPQAGAEIAVVLNSNDDDISLIDTATYREIKRVPIGKGPHHLIATPDNRFVIIGNTTSNDLVYLDPRTGDIVKRLARIADPYQLGFSPDGKWFVTAANRLDRVDIYRHENGELTLATKLNLPKTPSHIAFRIDSKQVWVTLQESNEVAAIDLATHKVAWIAPTGKQPAGIWPTPDGKHLLVGITGEDFVDVLSAHDGKSLQKLMTGAGAHNFLAMGDGRHVFLSNRVANTISIIDMATLKIVESFPVPNGPDDMELRKDGSELWVTTRWINRVSVIDMKTKKVKHSIRVGRSPHGLYFPGHAPRS
jgi:YVTN family beta-propeller protein